MDMNCKSIQGLMATGDNLSPLETDHLANCPACQGFVRNLKAIEADIPSLDATAPGHLRSKIESRLSRPQSRVTWQAVAVTVAMVAIVTTPLLQIASRRMTGKYVKGERLGKLPPFHAKFSGWNHMSYGDKLEGDLWFSGFAARTTTRGVDSLNFVEKGRVYQYWKPDGVLEKRVSRWGGTKKPVTKAEQTQIIDRWGPTVPAKGKWVRAIVPVSVNVFGREYKARKTLYRLLVTNPATITTVEVPTDEFVYTDLATERIVRIDLVAKFPGKPAQVEIREYEYASPADDRFEEATLKATPVTTTPVTQGG